MAMEPHQGCQRKKKKWTLLYQHASRRTITWSYSRSPNIIALCTAEYILRRKSKSVVRWPPRSVEELAQSSNCTGLCYFPIKLLEPDQTCSSSS
jgi:hypothetical protein